MSSDDESDTTDGSDSDDTETEANQSESGQSETTESESNGSEDHEKHKEDSPNASYPPTDGTPLIDYDKTVETGEGTIEGNEVEVELTIDFFLYSFDDWQFGLGTSLIPGVEIDEIPLSTISDKPIEEIMNDPDDRAEILTAIRLDPTITESQSDASRIETRPAPDTDVFHTEETMETWVTTGDERSVLVDVIKGPVNFASLPSDYDGDVNFATGVHRVYDDTPEGREAVVENTVPQEDLETAKQHHEIML